MTTRKPRSDARYLGREHGGDKRPFWLHFAAWIVKPIAMLMIKRTWRGMRNIPLKGGVIFAVNHISHADPLTVAHYIYNAGRNPRFLAKASVFKLPIIGALIGATGQVPVYRGGPDAIKSLHAAIDIVNAGQGVIFYPEGTNTSHPEHWPMKGRTGLARLAIETGAPVVPLAVWGPHKIFNPITKKITMRPRTPVTIVAGPPVDLSQWLDQAPTAPVLDEMTTAVMLRVRDLLAEVRGEEPPPLYDPRGAKARGKDA